MKKMFAALLALVCLISASAFAEGERTITVTGNATVLMDADSASVMLGVVSFAKDAGEASALNARRIDGLIRALENAGIQKKDITTSYYYVNARRNYGEPDENGDYAILGYEVSNSLSVVVRQIDQVGAVIDLALASGANNCDGISFATTQAGKAQDDALKAAIGEAKRRAALMAEACGDDLGSILSVSENYSNAGIYVNNKRAAMESADAAAGTQIFSDGLSFSATVTITFELIAR